ncbi:tRNA (adenosine(37)-N6)-threonylcarbamoyltransferase complex dimerization subunit type 1 TsaB [Oceanobacillus sp. CAU 1775]
MKLLAIDTSNNVLGIAIMEDDQIIGELVTNLNKNHSVRLMPAIHKLMGEVGVKAEDLEKIAIAKGPGSYTGVRIGLTTAKTLAWALNIPIVGVSSLEVLAYQGRFFDGYICPFFDARRGLVYSGLYKFENNQLVSIMEDKNMMMETLLENLSLENKKILFLSPDILSFEEEIKNKLEEKAIIPAGPFHIAQPSHLGLASLNYDADETHHLIPSYLRMAEAEANWLKQQKETEKNG